MTASPISDGLRQAIARSGVPYLRLERATGVARASIKRFVNGERSLRLDVADKLAAYFWLALTFDPKSVRRKSDS
jgi:plasmid maintenance system antidote protein VapI